MAEEPESWPLSDAHAAQLIEALAAAGDRRAAAEMFHAFDRRVAAPEQKRLALRAYERALWSRPREAASSVPAVRTPLVGRAEELERAIASLTEKRALQLIGPGGIGKSRLALEAARILNERMQWRACWIRVADGTGVEELAATAARTLRLPDGGGIDRLCDALADSAALVILDACENSLHAAEQFASRLIERCASARLILTSRSVLPELAETTAIEIGPLGAKAASAAEPAVRLFAERAMMANPHFAVTPENANDILAICSQLSGVPLAIEVACGYLAHVDVQELARRVREGATSDVSSIVAQTLSWRLQLLPQDDREIFLSLSIFDADFSLADAQALGGAQPPEHALERLSAAFLLVREAGAHGARFRLLDPVRAFAREELSEDDADRLRRRFIAYAAALGSISSAHAAQLAPTILAALRFAAALPDAVHDGLRVIANAAIPIGLGGFATATLQRVGELIERPGADASDAYDAALEAWSWLLSRCGQPRAAAQVNASRIERARSSGDSAGLAAALATSIIASRNIGEFALAAAYGEEAIALTRGCGDSRTLAKALRGLASVRMMEDRMREAADLFEELLALGELAVEETEYTMALHDYAVTLRALDRRMEAAALLRRCIQRALAASDYATAIHAQVTLARLSLDAGNIGEAHRLLKGTLPLCRHDINPITRMYAFEDLATASFKDGQYETLALALGYIDRARERAQFKAGAPQAEYIGKIRATVRSHLSAEIYQAEYRRGRMATLDEAFVQLESLEPGTVTLDAAERFAPLSAREREVAQLAAQGLTNREIAEKLIVSVRTVDAHMATIFRKLGIESRDQLIR